MKKTIPKPKQRNNHGRAKRKIKLLLLKNFCKRVMDKRAEKVAKLRRVKGKTLTSAEVAQIRALTRLPKIYYTKGIKNQRQQRKIWRQAPHMRKRA